MKLIEITNELPKSQEDWINWHNAHKTVMASAADFYHASKEGFIAKDEETNTRIYWTIPEKNNNYGRIIHNFNSIVKAPEIKELRVPEFSEKQFELEELLKAKEGKKFLQALFDTNDSEESIIHTLSVLGYGCEIKIEIPTLFKQMFI